MNSGIYILKWDNCKYYYYGSSIDLSRRRRNHFNRLSNGNHENFLLLKIFNKYGLPKFEVLECCTIEIIKDREQSYLNLCKGDKNNLNLLFDTNGAGRTFSDTSKQKISTSLKGRIFSERHLNNLKKANAGKNNPSFGNTRGKNANAKWVIDTKTGYIYTCAKDAADDKKIGYSTLLMKLRGVRKNNTGLVYYGESSESCKIQRASKKQEVNELSNKIVQICT